MTLIYCHLGPLPKHLFDSMLSVKIADPTISIALITDGSVDHVDHVDRVLFVNDIASAQTLRVMNEMPLFKNEANPLWSAALYRIFLVRDGLRYLEIDACYHFDSDVLLFCSTDVIESILNNFDGLSITPCNSKELVFGFSRFGSLSKADAVCDILCDVIFDPQKIPLYADGMLNEMTLMAGVYKHHSDLLHLLPTIPNEDTSVVFDPSSYGQYLGGTHQGHPPGWYGNHHDIGRLIGQGVLKPIMRDGIPYVDWSGKQYPIVNLHVHSKKTDLFMSSQVD